MDTLKHVNLNCFIIANAIVLVCFLFANEFILLFTDSKIIFYMYVHLFIYAIKLIELILMYIELRIEC